MTTREINAYFAGFFDGEGYIGVYNTSTKFKNLNLRITIGQGTKEILLKGQNRWGGCVYKRIDKRNDREHYVWEIVGQKASLFLDDIYPFVIVKKKQCTIAKAFKQIQRLRFGSEKRPQYIIDQTFRMRDEIKALNSPMGFGGIQKGVIK